MARIALLASGLLASCAGAPPDDSATTGSVGKCYATLSHGSTCWCLGIAGRTWVLRETSAERPPRLSGALPIDDTTTLKTSFTLSRGFGSVWVGYSGRPFGVVRVDADTLAVLSRIPIDTGWFSRRFGSIGQASAGSAGVFALADQRLHRIDPARNEVVDVVQFPRAEHVFVDGNDVWLAQGTNIVRLDPETLAAVQTFPLPPGMRVGWHIAPLIPAFSRDRAGVRIVVSDAKGRSALRFMRPDSDNETLVYIDGDPGPLYRGTDRRECDAVE